MLSGEAGDFLKKWGDVITILESIDNHQDEKEIPFLGALPAHFQEVCLAILILVEDGIDVSKLGLHELYGTSVDAMVLKIKPLLITPATGIDVDIKAVPVVLPPPDVSRKLDLDCSDTGESKALDPDVSVIDSMSSPTQSHKKTPAAKVTRRITSNALRYYIIHNNNNNCFMVPSPTD